MPHPLSGDAGVETRRFDTHFVCEKTSLAEKVLQKASRYDTLSFSPFACSAHFAFPSASTLSVGSIARARSLDFGGSEGGIRTHGADNRTTAFETAARLGEDDGSGSRAAEFQPRERHDPCAPVPLERGLPFARLMRLASSP